MTSGSRLTTIGRMPISRRAFIAGAAAAIAACGRRNEGDDGGGRRRSLALRGVNYDTEREVWRSEFVRREIETIRRDLHCNSILLLGSDLDRLTESAAVAADNGLHVWFEPRHFDSNAADTLEFVSTVARAAEELRADHPGVGLSVGCELTIFMAGIVPGDDWVARSVSLGSTPPADYNARLDAFFADALATVRPIFGGPITYSSGVWEEVDWRPFDMVGMDLYRTADNEATFVEDVRNLGRHGKPVVITEFGCCSFRGAEDMGGDGFTMVDYTRNPPVVAEGLVRDEQVQARYIDELLDVFEAERVHGAFVYDFIEPDTPHSPDPRHDYDMAGFGVVTCYPSGTDRAYDRTGHFEPKVAFDTIAARFA
jgi:hypothetical protein